MSAQPEPGVRLMGRAINLRLTEADVRTRCENQGISISAIEPLPAGGTHLVCTTGAGADEVRLRLADYIIDGVVRRYPFYRAGAPL